MLCSREHRCYVPGNINSEETAIVIACHVRPFRPITLRYFTSRCNKTEYYFHIFQQELENMTVLMPKHVSSGCSALISASWENRTHATLSTWVFHKYIFCFHISFPLFFSCKYMLFWDPKIDSSIPSTTNHMMLLTRSCCILPGIPYTNHSVHI